VSFGKQVKLLFAKDELIFCSSNASNTELDGNSKVIYELSDQIEGAATEGIELADSERDSSSTSDADIHAAPENITELWQDRLRRKRKLSNLLTPEGLHDENSRMKRPPRHPGK
jgi:hypothetical protein